MEYPIDILMYMWYAHENARIASGVPYVNSETRYSVE